MPREDTIRPKQHHSNRREVDGFWIVFPFRRPRTGYGSVILMLRQQFAERRGHLLFHTEVQLAFALTVTEGAVSVRKSDPKRTVSEPAEAIHRGAPSTTRFGYLTGQSRGQSTG